jgi:hypothetical protein
MAVGLGLGCMVATTAKAGLVEFSAGFSFSRTNYSEGNFSWVRRHGGSVRVAGFARSSLELAYQES